jgi:hypothetical protein
MPQVRITPEQAKALRGHPLSYDLSLSQIVRIVLNDYLKGQPVVFSKLPRTPVIEVPAHKARSYTPFILDSGEIKEANTYVGITGSDGLEFKKACKFWAEIRANHSLPESIVMWYDETTGVVTPEDAQP